MAEMSPEDVIKKIRNELILTAKKVKDGEIKPTVGNAVANVYRTALYAEQVHLQAQNKEQVIQVQEELSEADRERLDTIAKILVGEEPKPKRKRKGAVKDGNNKA